MGRRISCRHAVVTVAAVVAVVSSVGIGQHGRLAAAEGAKERELVDHAREHPFLFFTMADVPQMRSAARSTHSRYYEHLKAWGETFIDYAPIPADSLPGDRDTMQVCYENTAAYIVNMSLLWHLTGEERHYLAAERWLAAMCSYPAETDGGYFIGSYALSLAAGYDMLYPALSEAMRAKARDHLSAVLDRGVTGTTTDWWAGLRVHHDHWLPAAGLCIGAAAVADETDGGRDRLKFLSDHFDRAMQAVGEDGAWTEGVAQSTYAMAMSYIWFDVCKRVTGRDLFQSPMVRRHAAYRVYNHLPDGRYVFHHDSFAHGRYNVMGCASCHLMRKLAAELGSGQAQWLADREEPRDLRSIVEGTEPKSDWLTSRWSTVPALYAVAWNFLWYDPAVKAESPDAWPLHHVFENQGLVVARSGWSADDAVLTFACAPLGGHQARAEVLAGDERIPQNMGHIHAMAGSFNLFAGGNLLATSPGYGGRASRYENTLTIEGTDQRLHPRHEARITRLELADDHTYIAAEAGDCYPPEAGLAKWVRHVAWMLPDVLVIADDLVGNGSPASGKPTVWRMDVDPEANEVTVDGRRFRVSPRSEQGKAAMVGQILLPQTVTVTAEKVRPRGASWVMCEQVRATTPDVFGGAGRGHIVAVLEVLRDASADAGTVGLVEGPGVIGAVVSADDRSRAAVFVTDASEEAWAVTFTVTGRSELRCLVAGLPPEQVCTVELGQQAGRDGETVHTVRVRRGGETTTSAAGTLIVASAGGSAQ